MTKLTCIRAEADLEQIQRCKEKINTFGNSIEINARVLNLAGNAVRLKILFLLNEEGKLCPCDISDILEMTVPAVSQHLRKLKDSGLVKADKVGQTVYYSILPEHRVLLDSIFSLIVEDEEIPV